tara:strand:- start:747 stop:956 length:210 start_codon:yes stop_codon:yes gene_type:complete
MPIVSQRTNKEEIDAEIAKIDAERTQLETDDPEFFIRHPELDAEYLGRKIALEEIKPRIQNRDVAPAPR